jgi:hypothetical protein
MQKLVISGELPDLNQIIDASKQHWAKYHAVKHKYTELVALLAKVQLKPISEYPICIEIAWFCPDRRKDPDNIAHAKKYILDGLVEAGILDGDGWKHIAEFHDLFCVDDQNPRIEITISGTLDDN